jgi:hypothetical protein
MIFWDWKIENWPDLLSSGIKNGWFSGYPSK